jgi:hypothetical protein
MLLLKNLIIGYPGDYDSSECDEVILSDYDCITDLTTFYDGIGPVGFGYNTILGKSGVFGMKSESISTWSEYESSYSSYAYPLGSSTERASEDT